MRRVVMRESRYNPRARNHSFWGLMQISYPTARSMGFKGSPSELLDPVVNLTYAVPYLANAFIIAGKQEDAAVRLYAQRLLRDGEEPQHARASCAPRNRCRSAPDEGFLTATARPVSNLITAVVSGPPSQAALGRDSEPSAGGGWPAPDGGKGDGSGRRDGQRQEAGLHAAAEMDPGRRRDADRQGRTARRADRGLWRGVCRALSRRAAAAHGQEPKDHAIRVARRAAPDAQAYAGGAPPSSDAGPQAAIAQATRLRNPGAPAAGAGRDAATANPAATKGARCREEAARKAACSGSRSLTAQRQRTPPTPSTILAKKQPGRRPVRQRRSPPAPWPSPRRSEAPAPAEKWRPSRRGTSSLGSPRASAVQAARWASTAFTPG